MMHNHVFPAAAEFCGPTKADDLPTIATLWEEAKAARLALITLPGRTPEPDAAPYYARCEKAEALIGDLAPTTPREIAIHLRIFLGRNEQSAWGERLAFALLPHDDWGAIEQIGKEWVPVWRLICEMEGRALP